MKNKSIIFKVGMTVLIFSLLLTLYSYINNNDFLYSLKWSFIFSCFIFLGLYCFERTLWFDVLGIVIYNIANIVGYRTILENDIIRYSIIIVFALRSEKVKSYIIKIWSKI